MSSLESPTRPESPVDVVDVGPSRWAIVSKLQERTNILSQQDVTDGLGPAYVTEKFLCSSLDSSNTPAFMRVYKQVPIAGTEIKKASVRAAQAVKSYEPIELVALKSLQEKGCDCDEQAEDDTVPGGFIAYVIWEKVPGESLNTQKFWGYSLSEREEIRLKSREAYKAVQACGYGLFPGIKKIIYHRPTQTIYLSGFSGPYRTEDTQWSDDIYCAYGLVRPPTALDQIFPITSTDLKYDDKGWRW
ncbi:uncharacterized protein N7525_011076 [Penicillium rubens]|uniref:uncharacterized protein n=1 Tax=Penicillium rubens TaxID=1108849 RepID=UPI002A5AEF7F|nr:uncharacterized protein N7525_011076 [Penicillium rubens]KAJ5821792.1 hypothetical protein N7525_011076 [Penicillium rubens]